MTDFKNVITNILAIVLVIGGAANTYLESTSGDINYITLVVAIVTALIAFYTGKDKDGKAKFH
jgi:uncharacterized membrane protein YfcA